MMILCCVYTHADTHCQDTRRLRSTTETNDNFEDMRETIEISISNIPSNVEKEEKEEEKLINEERVRHDTIRHCEPHRKPFPARIPVDSMMAAADRNVSLSKTRPRATDGSLFPLLFL